MTKILSNQRIRRDLIDALSNPLRGVHIYLHASYNCKKCIFSIPVYSNHEFICQMYFEIEFSDDYPITAPTIICLTTDHILPNASLVINHINGRHYVCLTMLEMTSSTKHYDGWSSIYTLQSVLMQMQDFFGNSNFTDTSIPLIKLSVNTFEMNILNKHYEKMEYIDIFYEEGCVDSINSSSSIVSNLDSLIKSDIIKNDKENEIVSTDLSKASSSLILNMSTENIYEWKTVNKTKQKKKSETISVNNNDSNTYTRNNNIVNNLQHANTHNDISNHNSPNNHIKTKTLLTTDYLIKPNLLNPQGGEPYININSNNTYAAVTMRNSPTHASDTHSSLSHHSLLQSKQRSYFNNNQLNYSYNSSSSSNSHITYIRPPIVWDTLFQSLSPAGMILGETITYKSVYNETKGHSYISPSNRLQIKIKYTHNDFDLPIIAKTTLNPTNTNINTEPEIITMSQNKFTNKFFQLSTTVIQSILLYCNDIKSIFNTIITCKFLYHISIENSFFWKELLYRKFPLCKMIPIGLHGSGNEWKKIFFLEMNKVHYYDIKCFMTKLTYDFDIIGIPLEFTINPKTRRLDYIFSNMTFISYTAYKQLQCRYTIWREPFKAWLPIYITESHFHRALPLIIKSLIQLNNYSLTQSYDKNTNDKHIKNINSNSSNNNNNTTTNSQMSFKPEIILNILPKMMNTIIILLVDKGVAHHDTEHVLKGYSFIHRLFIALIKEFPILKSQICLKLSNFIKNSNDRHKKHCPSLGELLPLLSVCETIGWYDILETLVEESFTRSIIWIAKAIPIFATIIRKRSNNISNRIPLQSKNINYQKNDKISSISNITNNNKNQINISHDLKQQMLTSTTMSRNIYSFHCSFLRILVNAHPHGVNIEKVSQDYDKYYGFPTQYKIKQFFQYFDEKIKNINSWNDYFNTIHYRQMSQEYLSKFITKCIDLSLEKKYHKYSTNFSVIHKHGVSNLLLRGMSYPRIILCIDNSKSMNNKFIHPITGISITRSDYVKEIIINFFRSHTIQSKQQFNIIYFNHTMNQLWPNQLKLATPENIKIAINFCQEQIPIQENIENTFDSLANMNEITDFDLLFTTAFNTPNIHSIYLLSHGDIYDHNNYLVNTIKRLSQYVK